MSTIQEKPPVAVPTTNEAGPPVITGSYLSLTSYKRDGSPVATPVWFVEDGGRYYVNTAERSGKVKRIRRNPVVTIAKCNAGGVLKGEPVDARAAFVPETGRAQVDELMHHKYRIARFVVLPAYRLVMRLRGRGDSVTGPEAYLEITPG
jgi:PPOX class probable F420-dependent enzyme